MSSHRYTGMCEQIITNQTLQNKIKSKHFDLMITEGYLTFSCINIIPYNLGVPFIVFTIQPIPWPAGVPSLHPAHTMASRDAISPSSSYHGQQGCHLSIQPIPWLAGVPSLLICQLWTGSSMCFIFIHHIWL